METEINIVEILKDKPQGTKLYSSACGKCKLEEVDDKSFKISFYNSKFGFMNGGEGYLDKNGKLYDDGECVVFPSKEMRNWSKFAWKKGDILVSNDGKCKVIFERFDDDTYTSFVGKYYVECYGKNDELQDYEEEHYGDTVNYTKESEEAAQTYINTIEERLGGKLNRETLEIENAQPEFKDGDIVFVGSYMLGINTSSMIAIFRKEKEIDKYKFSPALCESNEHDTYLREDPVVLYTSEIMIFRSATDSEKQQLFDALAKKGKVWDAEKKKNVDIKKEYQFKPFEKVLVRDSYENKWRASFFSHIKEGYAKYVTTGFVWKFCIPYEGNEHLLGTTNNVED